MNFSANIIENWLLSGKAVLKNLSCGNAGLVVIPVPEGKTYIITKIEILPFANIIEDSETIAEPATFYNSVAQNLNRINTRNQYQLLFWNERLNNSWNIRNAFTIQQGQYGGEGTATTNPGNYYNKETIETFMVVESDCWMFLKYLDFSDNPPNITQAQLNTVFNKTWAPNPSWGYSDQYDIINFNNNVADTFSYVPQGLETSFSTPVDFFNNQYTTPSLNTTSGPTNSSAFIPPGPLTPGEVGFQLSPYQLQSIPLYNITYIEINRRLSTTGLL